MRSNQNLKGRGSGAQSFAQDSAVVRCGDLPFVKPKKKDILWKPNGWKFHISIEILISICPAAKSPEDLKKKKKKKSLKPKNQKKKEIQEMEDILTATTSRFLEATAKTKIKSVNRMKSTE
eukprot:jgi/Bigna1/130366/aug1.11_g5074